MKLHGQECIWLPGRVGRGHPVVSPRDEKSPFLRRCQGVVLKLNGNPAFLSRQAFVLFHPNFTLFHAMSYQIIPLLHERDESNGVFSPAFQPCKCLLK